MCLYNSKGIKDSNLSIFPNPAKHWGQRRLQLTVGSMVKINGLPHTKIFFSNIESPRAMPTLTILVNLRKESDLMTDVQTISFTYAARSYTRLGLSNC